MNMPKQPIKILFSRGTTLFMTVLVAATVVPQISNLQLASADDGGYPLVAAPELDVSKYDWGYATCPANDTGCYSLGYPEDSQTPTERMAAPWGYNLRNCT